MADKPQHATDEAQIRALIEQWSKAVRDEDRDAIRADHDADILMFDVPPPFLSRSLAAYMATWKHSSHRLKSPFHLPSTMSRSLAVPMSPSLRQ